MQRFCQLHPVPKTRGRPRLYPEALILTLALLQVRNNASWRQLRYACAPEALPTDALPALGTLFYRIHTIADERWHQLLAWLAQQGMALELEYKTRSNLLWVRRETHPGLPYGVGNNLNPRFALLDNAGNLYEVGDINGVLVILKYDADGNRLWRVDYAISGLSLQVGGAQVDRLGHVYVAGTGSSWYPYQYELIAIKAAPDGAILWQQRDSWHLLQRVDAAVLDAYDNFWLAGTR